MNLKELKAMIAEEYSNYLEEQVKLKTNIQNAMLTTV